MLIRVLCLSGVVVAIASSVGLAQPDRSEMAEIGRCVDGVAFRRWTGTNMGVTGDSWDHDGKSWRQREREFHFRVIGLKPTDFRILFVTLPDFPPGMEKHSQQDPREMCRRDNNMAYSADELHFQLSAIAARFSNRDVMGPMACRMTAVLMRNVSGVSQVPGRYQSLRRDRFADPQELYLHFEYLDPDAAAAHISKREEEAKKREEETKRDGGSK